MRYIILTILIASVYRIGAQAQSQKENSGLKGTIKVEVDGLSCPFCAYGLEKKLKKMEGVTKIEIDVENAFALLTMEEGKTVSKELIRKNVKQAGFTARKIKEVTNED